LPCETWHKQFINPWLEKNEPAPYQTLDERKAELIAEVWQTVSDDVGSILSLGEQINAVARSAELVNRKVDKVITAEEITELDTLKGLYDHIKEINADAAVKIDEIMKANDPDAVAIKEINPRVK
jgi:hypothetical protein